MEEKDTAIYLMETMCGKDTQYFIPALSHTASSAHFVLVALDLGGSQVFGG